MEVEVAGVARTSQTLQRLAEEVAEEEAEEQESRQVVVGNEVSS